MALRNENFSSFRQVDDGLNALLDPQDIMNTEVASIQNMLFRNGYPESRSGSKLKFLKPTGETNNLLNLFRARDSTGANFCVAIYAPNFYVWDDSNAQWIKISNAYNVTTAPNSYTPSPTYASYLYGYVNWNAGKSADVLYCGNGQELCIKWNITLRYLTVAAGAGDSTLTVDDGSYFPATGTIVVKAAGGSEIYATLSSVSGNVLTLSAPLGTAAGIGAAVTFQIASDSNVPQGNILAKQDGRLFVAGKPKYETVVYFSVINNPEDFMTTGHADSSGNKPITDGNGGITALIDFGEYLLVTKQDSAYKLEFTVDQTLDSFLITTTPVFTDASLGPVTNAATVKKNNDLLFPTMTEGIFSLTPSSTGSITQVDPVQIAADIYRVYNALNFALARGASWNQLVFWSCASSTVSDTVLVLDLVKSDKKGKYVWTVFNNWGVQDWLVYRDTTGEFLYFGNRIDGNIYQALSSDYVDLETSTSQTAYNCSFLTKRYDYGFSPTQLGQPENSRAMISYFSHPDKLKTADLLHVQGYITTVGTLYIDVMYNEAGKFSLITKSIKGTENLVVQPPTPALAQIMMGLPILGGTEPVSSTMGNIGFINEYIPLPKGLAFSNIQFKFYTIDPGVHWGVTGYAYNGIMHDAISSALVQVS